MNKNTLNLIRYMINQENPSLLYSEIKAYIIDLNNKIESENDFFFEFDGVEHRIIHEDYIDEIWTESLIEQIKDCYDLSDIPSFVAIDWEQTAENCKIDGLGHHFNYYNGSEDYIGNYYVFRLGA